MCQYVSVRVNTCQYVSVCVSTRLYASIHVSMHQYASVRVSMRQYASVRVSICARKIQGYVTFWKCYISLYFPYLLYVCKKNTRICNISKSKFWTCNLKSYVSLYFPAMQYILKKNTRIHNFSNLPQKIVTRNVMYPCIFLAFYMYARKLQGYIIFGMITLFSSEKSGLKNTRIHNFSKQVI